MGTVNNLLVEIQKAIGCPYLSDLHSDYRLHNEQAQQLIMAIPLEKYSLQEWNVAASYVTGEICCYQTEKEARERIIAS